MAESPRITDADIVEWVGGDSLAKGRAYYEQGAVDQTRRQGLTLKGRCAGYSYPYYYVQATLASDGSIEGAECNCPVESDFCKHVAALLLTYRHEPDRFTATQEVAAGLAERSKEELITLVQQLLEHAPELSYLAEMRLPGAGAQGERVDPEPYRKQVRAVLDGIDYYDWQALERAARELEPLLQIATDFQRRGDAANAGRVAMAILGEVIAAQDDFQDEGGQISGFVAGAVPLLMEALPDLEAERAERNRVLQFLLDIYWYAALYEPDGLMESLRGVLGQQTTPTERVELARLVRAELDRDELEDWHEEAGDDLLFDLEADSLDEETYLTQLRERGRNLDLVRELLKRGRATEAVETAVKQSDELLPVLVDYFQSYAAAELLEPHMRNREKDSWSPAFLRWLFERFVETEPARALDLGERLFRLPTVYGQPTVSYEVLRELAIRCGRWEELYPQLIEWLESQNQWKLVSEAFLLEGEIDRALALVGASKNDDLDPIPIARAAEATRPRAAIEIYRTQADGYIAHRDRGSYAAAAGLLVRVRNHYRQIGDVPAWERSISALCEKNFRLTALRDELAKAGL